MKRIGVFTSGGDSPGMNAAVRAVVRTAIYREIEVWGIYYGYKGMINGQLERLNSRSVGNIIQRGGTILKSARSKEFMEKAGRKKAFENLKKHEIDGIVAIGGNGTFTGAQLFFEEFGIPTVGMPGTIDNDLYGTDFTIGYDTAVNTALQAVDKIRDTADSHDRIFFIELMGRDSGYITMYTAIAGGAELAMVPETKTSIAEVVETLVSSQKKGKASSIIIVAEGDEEGNALEVIEKVKKAMPAPCPMRVAILGHIQRGGAPSAADRILASRLGVAAVDGLLSGKQSCMAGIINNQIVYTPFADCISKQKNWPEDLNNMIQVLSI